MTDVSTSYVNADVHGRASFAELDRFVQEFLLAGSEPALAPAIGLPMANDTTFAQFSVVGLNAAGKIALAVQEDETTPITPIGVLAHAAALGATGSANAQVWYSGCFNIDDNSPLVWDSSFATTAMKEAAFRGSPTPTTIVTRLRTTPAA